MPERSAGPRTGAFPSGRVLVLGQFDGFANGLKPTEVARFLEARGHRVHVVDTYYLSRAANNGALRHLPGVSASQVALFCVERGIGTVLRLGVAARRRLSYPLLRAELRPAASSAPASTAAARRRPSHLRNPPRCTRSARRGNNDDLLRLPHTVGGRAVP